MPEIKENIIGTALIGIPKNPHLNRKIQSLGNTKKDCVVVPLENDQGNIQL